MGLKPPPMSSPIKSQWVDESRWILKRLLEIIEPKIIITTGRIATQTVGKIYGIPTTGTLANMVDRAKPLNSDKPFIFPVYHTGRYGLVTRPEAQQERDWKLIKTWCDDHGVVIR